MGELIAIGLGVRDQPPDREAQRGWNTPRVSTLAITLAMEITQDAISMRVVVRLFDLLHAYSS
jgi:hypothetical protein